MHHAYALGLDGVHHHLPAHGALLVVMINDYARYFNSARLVYAGFTNQLIISFYPLHKGLVMMVVRNQYDIGRLINQPVSHRFVIRIDHDRLSVCQFYLKAGMPQPFYDHNTILPILIFDFILNI